MEITEILRRIWLFSASDKKSSESFSKQPTQIIIATHNCHNGVLRYSFQHCESSKNNSRVRKFLLCQIHSFNSFKKSVERSLQQVDDQSID